MPRIKTIAERKRTEMNAKIRDELHHLKLYSEMNLTEIASETALSYGAVQRLFTDPGKSTMDTYYKVKICLIDAKARNGG